MVVQALGNQHVDNTQQQRQVAARTHAEPAIGKRGRAAAPGVNHDDLRSAPARIVERINGPHRRRIDNGTPQVHDAAGMRKVGGGTITQAVFPTGKSAYLAGAIGTVHVGRTQRMHKAIGPVAVERGNAERHAQRTGAALVNNPQKTLGNLSKRLVPGNRIKPRAIPAASHGVHNAVALVKRHCQAMPSAGAQGTRRARMPRNRQLSHHTSILNMGRKGAIGIASPACRHHGATVMHNYRCHLDYSFQLRGSSPTAPQLCHQLPRRKTRSIHRSKTRRASQKANAPREART